MIINCKKKEKKKKMFQAFSLAKNNFPSKLALWYNYTNVIL